MTPMTAYVVSLVLSIVPDVDEAVLLHGQYSDCWSEYLFKVFILPYPLYDERQTRRFSRIYGAVHDRYFKSIVIW